MTRPDRGEYRSVYIVLLDGPDYQRLSPAARLVFLTLKLTAGSTGLLVYPGAAHVLAERTGHTPAEVEAALVELEQAPGDWLQRDGNMVWVVRQLEFEPSLSRSNANHRGWLEAHIRGLPRLPIVTRFKDRYADWFPVPEGVASNGVPSPLQADTPSHPHTIPHTTGITTTRYNHQKQPPESTTTTRGATNGNPVALPYLARCVIALNAGLARNPALTGYREVSTSEQQGRVTWEADGIPIETAERVITEQTARYQPTPRNRQPHSLRYFDNAVRAAHERATLPAGESVRGANPFADLARDMEAETRAV